MKKMDLNKLLIPSVYVLGITAFAFCLVAIAKGIKNYSKDVELDRLKTVFNDTTETINNVEDSINENVIFDDELSYQNVFNESKLLITDFSSVAFDFAYMKKPVLYYQWENDDFHFDLTESYFDYEEMGFGEKTNDENELIHLIKKHIDDDCQMKEKFKQRVDDFYRFTDKNNCKRVYDYILTIK